MFYNCFSGEELVDWIRRRDNGISDSDLATTIGQGLLDRGFIQSLTGDKSFECNTTPYKAVPAMARKASMQVDRTLEGEFLFGKTNLCLFHLLSARSER